MSSSSRSTSGSSVSQSSRTIRSPRSTSSGPSGAPSPGNIYLGTVDNVLPGMEAAFIEIGLEKNGFLYVDEIVTPELEGKARHGKKIQDTDQPRADDHGAGGQGSDEDERRAAHDRDLAARPLRRLPAERRRFRRVPPARRRGALAPQGHPQGSRPEGRRRDRAHGRGGRVGRGHRTRPRLPPEALEGDRCEREEGEAAEPPLPGGGATAPCHARSLHRELRARARRPGPGVQAHRRLPQEDVAAHGGAGRALQGEAAADGGVRGRRGDQVDAEPSCRPAVRRLSDLRLRRGVHRHRREHRPLRRLALAARPARASRTRSRRTTSRR
mgnify:CR=1 FL=1